MQLRKTIVLSVSGMLAIVAASTFISGAGQSRALGLKELESLTRAAMTENYRLEAAGWASQIKSGGLKETRAKWDEAISASDTALSKFLDRAPAYLDDAVAVETIANIKDRWLRAKETFSDLNSLLDELGKSNARILVNVLGMTKANIQVSADMGTYYAESELLGKVLDRYQNAVLFSDDITKDMYGILATLALKADAAVKASRLIGYGALLLAMTSALLASFLFATSISRRVHRIESVMQSAANKDLSARTNDRAKDELGRLAGHVNTVMDILRQFMERAQGAANELRAVESGFAEAAEAAEISSQGIVSGTEVIGKSVAVLDEDIGKTLGAARIVGASVRSFGALADEQASELTLIATAVEEMAASINSAAKLADQRLEMAAGLVGAVSAGADEAESSAETLLKAEKELERILEISLMISSVADRTNVLSMNAAIESAHAGEAGRGFAVVADEIRKLSDTASENASGIDTVVASVEKSLRESLVSAQRSSAVLSETRDSVQAFVTALGEIGTSFRELSSAVKEVLESAGKISSSARLIRNGAESAVMGSGTIETGLQSVMQSSHLVVERIDDIRGGIAKLFTSVESLSSLASGTGARSKDLNTMLREFSLGESVSQV